MKNTTFGWRANQYANGFERDHGRFTMEVFWFEAKRAWGWTVWAAGMVDGKKDQVIVSQGRSSDGTLDNAKIEVHREVSLLEKEAIAEDKKFR